MQDELEQLRGENGRLRIIISALADKIRSIENLLNSNVPESIGVKKSNEDIPAGSIGVNYPNDSIPIESIGVNLLNTSYDFQSIGEKNEKDNIAFKNIGVNSLEEPVSDKRIGEKRLTWVLAVNGFALS